MSLLLFPLHGWWYTDPGEKDSEPLTFNKGQTGEEEASSSETTGMATVGGTVAG